MNDVYFDGLKSPLKCYSLTKNDAVIRKWYASLLGQNRPECVIRVKKAQTVIYSGKAMRSHSISM